MTRSKKRTEYAQPKGDDKANMSKLTTPKALAMLLKNGEKCTPVRTKGIEATICKSDISILAWPNILFTFFNRFIRCTTLSFVLPATTLEVLRPRKMTTKQYRRMHNTSSGINAFPIGAPASQGLHASPCRTKPLAQTKHRVPL